MPKGASTILIVAIVALRKKASNSPVLPNPKFRRLRYQNSNPVRQITVNPATKKIQNGGAESRLLAGSFGMIDTTVAPANPNSSRASLTLLDKGIRFFFCWAGCGYCRDCCGPAGSEGGVGGFTVSVETLSCL